MSNGTNGDCHNSYDNDDPSRPPIPTPFREQRLAHVVVQEKGASRAQPFKRERKEGFFGPIPIGSPSFPSPLIDVNCLRMARVVLKMLA